MVHGFISLPWLRIAVHLGAWLPLVVLVAQAALDQLGAEPIRAAILRTGKTALVLLVLSLACTPLNTLFGFKPALKVRRALGLYAFLYAALHLTLFVGVDYGFNGRLLVDAMLTKRYTLVGLAAGTILLLLAVTSFNVLEKAAGQRLEAPAPAGLPGGAAGGGPFHLAGQAGCGGALLLAGGGRAAAVAAPAFYPAGDHPPALSSRSQSVASFPSQDCHETIRPTFGCER